MACLKNSLLNIYDWKPFSTMRSILRWCLIQPLYMKTPMRSKQCNTICSLLGPTVLRGSKSDFKFHVQMKILKSLLFYLLCQQLAEPLGELPSADFAVNGICLPSAKDQFAGMKCKVAGWGHLIPGGDNALSIAFG